MMGKHQEICKCIFFGLIHNRPGSCLHSGLKDRREEQDVEMSSFPFQQPPKMKPLKKYILSAWQCEGIFQV